MKCASCLKNLEFYVEHEGQVYCLKCHEEKFANKCAACVKLILAGSKAIKMTAFKWFHSECFNCCVCKTNLANTHFEKRKGKPYCSKCFGEAFIGKCFTCNEIIEPGEAKIQNEGTTWHEKCFLCTDCKSSLNDIDVFPVDDGGLLCETCYKTKAAAVCKKCDQPIIGDFLQMKDDFYHVDCLKCEKCSKKLSGQQVIKFNDFPYCKDCYTKYCADKCTSCHNPITTQDAVKHEENSWHKPCFICRKCKKSLISQDFLWKRRFIYCPKCA